MFDINKQKLNLCILSGLVRCYFDLIFDQQVEVIFVDRFRNDKTFIKMSAA